MIAHVETSESWQDRWDNDLFRDPETVCGQTPMKAGDRYASYWAVYNYDEAVRCVNGRPMKAGKVPVCGKCMGIISESCV